MQNILLPVFYRRAARKDVVKGRIIFADAHHNEMPFSMRLINERLKENGYEVIDFITNYSDMSAIRLFKYMVNFMKTYAVSEYVFICDNYLPVASCNKRPETTVIQLWHSGGLMKKFGYDTAEDIPKYYKGNVYKNYDLITVSAPCCEEPLSHAMRLPLSTARALGTSRTDYYYMDDYNESCRKKFYETHPDAVGKKILLWAPTYRGASSDPKVLGVEAIRKLQTQLTDEWYVIIKVHPYCDRKEQISNSPLPTEEILPVTNLFITDFSSVLYDYLIYERPFVLFAEDIEEYTDKRGLYIDYYSLPCPVATDASELFEAVTVKVNDYTHEEIAAFKQEQMTACTGHATDNILRELNLLKNAD